jgi:tRNA A-37 threonylcarbamoyl transferase component Bud32
MYTVAAVTNRHLVIARHHAALCSLGLDSLEGVRRFHGQAIDGHPGRRDIHRILTTDDHGRPLALFMKRIHRAFPREAVRSLVSRGRIWSTARQEWEHALALERAGIHTAGLVAYGEQFGLLLERFSFIITEEAAGQCMENFVRTCHDRFLRRRVFEELARLVRRLHDSGLAAPDLLLRHLFVSVAGPVPSFCLIDTNRLDRGRITRRRRARDIAALHVSAPLAAVSLPERLRFLRAYAGSSHRPLFHLIARRARHQLRKKRFLSFYS